MSEDLFKNPITSEGDTEFPVVDEGEYQGRITEYEINKRRSKDGNEFYVLDLQVSIEDVEQMERMNNPRAKLGITIDTKLDSKGNDVPDMGEGKNVRLNRLRDALGQNTSEKWTPEKLIGGVIKAGVTHDVTPTGIYPKVKYFSARD